MITITARMVLPALSPGGVYYHYYYYYYYYYYHYHYQYHLTTT